MFTGGLAYFLVVFAAGFVLGVLRTLVVIPAVGELLGVVIELPVILTVSWIACGWAVLRFDVPGTTATRMAMGALAFALLMVGEVLVSITLADRSLAEHWALYRSLPARIGLLGQLVYAVFPLVRHRRRRDLDS